MNDTPRYDDDPHGDGRLISSFRYAWAGILYVLRSQRNFRIHLAITTLVVLLGLWLRLSWGEWAILALTIALVLMAEMFNTVAETAIDMATNHFHPLAKIAKDVAAGAVLIMAIIAVIVGALILGPHLIDRLQPILR
jgi:diacylglycerol kinase